MLPSLLPSTFYTGLNFPFLCRNSALSTKIPPVMNMNNTFFLKFVSHPQCGSRAARPGQVCDSARISLVLWGPGGEGGSGLGGAPLLRQKKCFCAPLDAGGRFTAGSLRRHSFLSQGSSGGPPSQRSWAGGAQVLGGKPAAAVFGFPLVLGI